ncbi:MAG TPA: sigma-70 family RNA polymerase sigma factor [Pirellulales bacterium]|nr:sigma-70 family RNA polymerase sigma factor [Pirellulales bacterium]
MPSAQLQPELLLERAREGDVQALGTLLEEYREYLRLLARPRVGRGLQVRLDPSDLVQEVLLEAHRDFGQFLGRTEAELTAWLRRILVRNLADQVKHHQSQRRDYTREQPLELLVEQAHEALAAPLSTPSAHAARREQAVVLANALTQLSDDYREVITRRHVEGQSFEAIAAGTGRSPGAVRMLWMRALERLGSLLEQRDAAT